MAETHHTKSENSLFKVPLMSNKARDPLPQVSDLMRVSNTQADTVVYVITTTRDSHNQRIKSILRLRKHFLNMVLVTRTGTQTDQDHIVVGAYPNPTAFLRFIGLQNIKSVLDRYCFFPSPNILYALRAVARLKKPILSDLQKGKSVCLITSVPKHDLCLVGHYLKRRFNQIRWIIDWRDLWSYDEYYLNRVWKPYRKIVPILEKIMLNACDINVTTNYKAKAVLENSCGVLPSRVISINHAYNAQERSSFADVSAKSGPLTIGFLGNLFKPPKVPGFQVVQAINEVLENGLNVEFHIFGDNTKEATNMAKTSYNGKIILHARTSHEESLKKLASCDFLLLALSNLPNCDVIMHRKLPHYLMLNRPILAIVPTRSFVADTIRRTGSGYVIPSTSQWSAELKRILQDYMDSGKLPIRNQHAIEEFSWDNISQEWMKVLGNAF